MNIAFIGYTSHVENFCRGLMDTLKSRGHKVCFFYQVGSSERRDDLKQMSWTQFSLRPLHAFNPDRVLIFNGWAEESKPATHLIEHTWDTYYFEIGWLPQKGHIYVDKHGLGARSYIAGEDLSAKENIDPEEMKKVWDVLRAYYNPGKRPSFLPPKFILVPLQLEHDTSIKYDSPYFKTMSTFLQFVTRAYLGRNIVIKTHPKETAAAPKPKDGKITVVTNQCSMNTLAAYASHIVGINSTSLMEALVHLRPIAALGNNVLTGSDVWIQPKEALTNPKRLLNYHPDISKIERVIYQLYKRQVPWKGITPGAERVCKGIES